MRKITAKENGSREVTPLSGNTMAMNPGLTKREYFAALAMQGMLAGKAYGYDEPEDMAIDAIYFADKLLEILAR